MSSEDVSYQLGIVENLLNTLVNSQNQQQLQYHQLQQNFNNLAQLLEGLQLEVRNIMRQLADVSIRLDDPNDLGEVIQGQTSLLEEVHALQDLILSLEVSWVPPK